MTREEKIALLEEQDKKVSRANNIATLKEREKKERLSEYGIQSHIQPFLNGVTRGWAGELSALANAGIDKALGDIPEGKGFWDQYSDISSKNKAWEDQYSSDNPLLSMAGNTAGGFAGGGPLVKMAGDSLKKLVALGLAEGGIAGAGYADEGDRATGAGVGALLGGGISGGLKKAGDMFTGRRSAGAEQFTKAMNSDEIEKEIIFNAMDKGTLPVDAGPNIAAQARAIAGSPGRGAKILDKTLSERQDAMGPNLINKIQKHTGADFNVQGNIDEIEAAREALAGPMYKELRDIPIRPTEDMESLLNDSDLRPLFNKAKKTTLGYGVNINDFDDPVSSFNFWDTSKKYMDDKARNLYRKGNNYEGGQLTGAKNAMMDDITEQTGGLYKEARNVWSDSAGMIDAAQLGQKAMKMPAWEVNKAIENMPTGEKQMFINGMAENIGEMISRQPETANLARNLRKSPLMRNKLKAAFPSEGSYAKFMDDVEHYAKQGETFNSVLRGSQTAQTQANMQGMAPDSIMAELIGINDPITAGIKVGGNLFDKARGIRANRYNAKIGEEFAKIATAPNQKEFEKLMRFNSKKRNLNKLTPGAITGLMQYLSQD